MDRHEMKARFEAQTDEWKRNLDTATAKAEAAVGEGRAKHLKAASSIQEQLDELKIQAAKSWDAADDVWEAQSKELEAKWEEWQERAKRAMRELTV